MRNDGWQGVDYRIVDDDALNARLASLLNEACHVFHHHASGTWQSHDKDRYASALATEISVQRSLIRKLLAIDDRVVQSITYRAVELLEDSSQQVRDR